MKRKIYMFFLVLLIFLVSCGQTQAETVKHDYFEKAMYTIFQFDSKEKENINYFLESYYVENNKVSGFSKYEAKYDLNLINNSLELSLNCNDDTSYASLYKKVFEKLKNINVSQIENGYDLYCYFSLAMEYNLPISNEFYSLLNYYFDKEDGLFSYNGNNDLEETKLSMTINIYSILKDDMIFISKYGNIIKNKINTMYNDFIFLEPISSSSIYNSGGRIIIASHLILGKNNFNDKMVWYYKWKEQNRNINDLLSASNYCDFIDIMSLFEEPNYSKLDNYLITLNEVNLNSDLQCLSNVSKHIDITNYNFYSNLNLNEYINNITLIKDNIDIENTYYGYLLSQMTEFKIHQNKLNVLLNMYYNMISNENTVDKLSHYIYYTVGLDICINKSISCDLNMLLDKINYILDSEARSIDFRKIIETVSAISIFESITISRDNTNKITNEINEIFSDINNLTNSLASDLLIMDYDINGTINIEIFNKLKDNLYYDGGFKSINTDSEANIVSTYALYKLNTISTENKYILDNILFVNSLKADDGIYTYSINDKTVDLKTIWYGNIIAKTKVGVKNDETKN